MVLSSQLAAQQRSETAAESFTLADIMSAPFPSELRAAPNGRALAWIGDEEGKRNLWVAEAPGWHARRLTRWLADDGQELSELTWSADSRWLLVVRGGDSGANHDDHDPANPTSDPRGTDQAVWITALRGGVPRRLGDGFHPVPSPRGDRVVWILRDTLRTAPLASAAAPQILLKLRGASDAEAFAPDGRTLAFVSRRGDHAFIGLYDFTAKTIRWVSPSTFRDDLPRWSPDGKLLAFIRRPGAAYARSDPLPRLDSTASTWTPWAVRVADPKTGVSREVWHSPPNSDGGFRVSPTSGRSSGAPATGWCSRRSRPGGSASTWSAPRAAMRTASRRPDARSTTWCSRPTARRPCMRATAATSTVVTSSG